MRVAHAVGWYFPDHVGGSEVYVRGLCQHLRRRGIDCVVVAPSARGDTEHYDHEGVEVYRCPAQDLERFDALVRELRPDVFHLHSQVTGAGLAQLQVARRHVARTVTTVHVPRALCVRGTLMHMGAVACDGRIDASRCAACWAQERGLSRPAAEALARISPFAGRLLPQGRAGRLGTALHAQAFVRRHQRQLHELAEASDRVVAVAGFLREALRLNGIAESKLHLCRQGVDRPEGHPPTRVRAVGPGGPLRLCFVGRWDRLKGADVVARAVAALAPRVQVTLTLHGSGDGPEARRNRAEVEALAGQDERIRVRGALPPDSVIATFASHDVAVVPSVWLETGPLVAMEALVAGVPVLGSDLGGLRELIEHGQNGWLVKAGSVPAWRRAIERLAREGLPAGLDRSARGVSTMAEVAAQMVALYPPENP